MLGVLVIVTLVARFVVVFGLFPLLEHGPARRAHRPAYGVVIVWGGLRGAVSLALGLAVAENDSLPQELRHMVARADHRLRAVHPAGQRHQPEPADQAPGARPAAAGGTGPARPRAHLALEGIKDAALARSPWPTTSPPTRSARSTEEYDRRIAAAEARARADAEAVSRSDLVYRGLAHPGEPRERAGAGQARSGHPAAQRCRCADRRMRRRLGDAAKIGGIADYEKAARQRRRLSPQSSASPSGCTSISASSGRWPPRSPSASSACCWSA